MTRKWRQQVEMKSRKQRETVAVKFRAHFMSPAAAALRFSVSEKWDLQVSRFDLLLSVSVIYIQMQIITSYLNAVHYSSTWTGSEAHFVKESQWNASQTKTKFTVDINLRCNLFY